MTKYAISQEGAEAMQKLAGDILQVSDGVKQATQQLKKELQSNMDELGVYGIDIWSITLQIDGILMDRQEDFIQLSEAAKKRADDILRLMEMTSTNTSASHSGSKSLIQRNHRPLISTKEKRINEIINDVNYGSGEIISSEKAEKIHESIRDYTGSFSHDIRAAYNNPNADPYYKKQMDLLDEYINISPKWQGEIFRGINVDNKTARKILANDTIDMLGPSSWSSDEYVAKRFADQSKQSRIVFVLNDNKSGASITHIAIYNGSESEVMAPSGVKYVKESVEQKIIDGKKYIYVRVHEMR